MADRVQSVFKVDCTQELIQYNGAILYLRALQDNLVTKKNLDIMQSLKPGIKEITLEASHLLFQKAPKDGALAIRSFIKDLETDNPI